jgi:REase_AHJR-like protein
MEAIASLERQRARAIAEEYRSRGYAVIEEPSPDQLPEFLSGYTPDLLIRKGNEAVVVEVKSRSSLAKDPRVRDLARLLQAKPNWRFELVVLGEEGNLSSPEGTRPFEREDILRNIEAAERLLDSGFSEAALLLAWPTLEAILRLLTGEEGLLLDRLTPLNILKQAVINGVISRDDYSFLMNVMKYRNALAHGFKTIEFDSALVKDLINTTKRLLQSTTVP